MKTKILLPLVFIISFYSSLYSQNYSWYQLPNSPYAFGRFENMSFINENTGWLIHTNGVVFRTTDAGDSWIRQDSIYLGTFRSVTFINESTGWIGSLNSNFVLFKTTNGGFNWNTVSLPNPVPVGICGMHSIDQDFIYGCGRYDGFANFIKSTDGGNTWITKDMTNYASSLVDCYFFNRDTGIAVGSQGVSTDRVSRIIMTTDGGTTWEVKYTGTRNREGGWKISFVDKNNGFVSLERTTIPEKYFVKTTDGGKSWTELPFQSANEQGIGFINSNTGWIGGYFQPTYGTTNGGTTWFNANIGININRFLMFGDTLGYSCGQYVFKYSKTVGINQINSIVPEDFYLNQNYPNPFNSSTNINFGIQNKSLVRLHVYDILGRKISTLVDQYLLPGSYEVNFSDNSINSGIYYYSLESENFKEIKKMVLLR